MSKYFRFVRFAIIWLIIFMIGRFVLGAAGVPYLPRGTMIFSMVPFCIAASLIYGGFSRGYGYKWYQGLLLGTAIGLSGQILIFLATVVSYLVGAETYFNNPEALNATAAIPVGQAVVARIGGLVTNTILNSIVALIGWAMGNLMPARS
jgi:hypothetical protein